jgi:hypothetical protein
LLVSLPAVRNDSNLEENMLATVATTTKRASDGDDVSVTTSSLGTGLLPSTEQKGQPQSEIVDSSGNGSIPLQQQQQQQLFESQGLQESRKTRTRQRRRRHSEQMHTQQMHFSTSALPSPTRYHHHLQQQQQQQQQNMWIDKFSKSWNVIFSMDNNNDDDDDDYDPPVLDTNISPSSTVHVRPRLIERAIMAEECRQQQRQQQSASSLLDDDNLHVPTTTTTTTATTPATTQHEDASCHLSVSGISLDLEDILTTTATETPTTTSLDDPFQIACQAARTQYQQDYEHSRIVDKSHKFPQFDVKEFIWVDCWVRVALPKC